MADRSVGRSVVRSRARQTTDGGRRTTDEGERGGAGRRSRARLALPAVARRRAMSLDGDDVMTTATGTARGRRRAATTRAVATRAVVMVTVMTTRVVRAFAASVTTVTPTVNSRDPARFGVVPSGRSGAASATFVANATVNASATPRLVVFGGSGGGGDVNDVWEYDAGMTAGTGAREGAWTRLHDGEATTGTAPTARSGASACALRGNLYVFGGYSGVRGDLDDLWTFDRAGGTWREISPAGDVKPPKRSGATLSTPEGESGAEFILFAGNGFNDVWSFNIDTNAWTLVRDNTATSGATSTATARALLCAAAAVSFLLHS